MNTEEFVDNQEALLDGGLADDPRELDPVDQALVHLTEGTRQAIAILVDRMTPRNSARTLLQLAKTADHMHHIAMLYNLDEDPLLEDSPLGRKKRKIQTQMNRETAGVKLATELFGTLGQILGQRSITDELRAVKAARDAGMDDVAEELEAKIRKSMTSGGLPEIDMDTITEHVSAIVSTHADETEGFICDTNDVGYEEEINAPVYDMLGELAESI